MAGDALLPVKVLDIELSRPLGALQGLHGYRGVRAYIRAHGVPLGYADLPLHQGGCSVETVRNVILGTYGDRVPAAIGREAGMPPVVGPWPTLTIAVCTRERADELTGCLGSLLDLDYPGVEILVVDNAPLTDATAEVCSAHDRVEHVVEPRPGLDWARNRAVLHASGQILAFTDDDVRVDPDWGRWLVRPFLEDAGVMAVAGLVVPLELETRAQLVFEEYGGLSGGFRAMKMGGVPDWGVRGMWHYALMAQHGSGANMAFRRCVFDRIGRFDPALDVGTVTNGGGDTEMLFRIMAEGFAMVYEPRAVVRHRHRREDEALQRQISGWGSGTYAWLTRSAVAYPEAWWVMALLGLRGLFLQVIRLLRPRGAPRGLVLAELGGALVGPFRYVQARVRAKRLEREWGPQERDIRHEC